MNSNYDDSTREDKQMKLRHLMLALMLAAGLSGCSSYSIESRHSYDSRTDFSGMNSYAWAPVNEAIFSTSASADHFQSTMDSMLATKGFNLNPEAPDFLISTHVVKYYVEKYKSIHGDVEFPKAMIRVNFLDSSSNNVIYESAAYAYMSGDEKQETKNAIIDKAVEALLSGFPPGR
jgi:hypothetical protein